MVNTGAGSSTGPTEMNLSGEVKSYLDQQFSQLLKCLAAKEDINQSIREVCPNYTLYHTFYVFALTTF